MIFHGRNAYFYVRASLLLPMFSGLISCGNGSSSTAQNSVEQTPYKTSTVYAAAAPYDSSGESFLETFTISGRVADGYIRGATVCVDLDHSGSCEIKEPKTLSSFGGIYSLKISRAMAGKSVVAEVPETAIDEDTGAPIGARMTFSTPPDRPWFISPLTTLVTRELHSNPAQSTVEAEQAVLAELGIPDAGEGSLFANYIENRDHPEKERREKFRYLHEVARWTAASFGEINRRVESAALIHGIDLISDLAAQSAVRELVVDETRKLLPLISRGILREWSETSQVAIERLNAGSGAFAVQSGLVLNAETGSLGITEFQTTIRVAELIPKILQEDIVENIYARISKPSAVRVHRQVELPSELFVAEMDCGKATSLAIHRPFFEDRHSASLAVLRGSGQPLSYRRISQYQGTLWAAYGAAAEASQNCAPAIRALKISENGKFWALIPYRYDAYLKHSGINPNRADGVESWLALGVGKWNPIDHSIPTGNTFMNPGGKLSIKTPAQTSQINIAQRQLGQLSLSEYFYYSEIEDVQQRSRSGLRNHRELSFPEGAAEYRFSVTQLEPLDIIYNLTDVDEGGNDNCIQFNGNCNVIRLGKTRDQVLRSLSELRAERFLLPEMLIESAGSYAFDVLLDQSGEGYPGAREGHPVKWYRRLLTEDSVVANRPEDALANPPESAVFAESQWRWTHRDGIEMIEIELPLAVRLRLGKSVQSTVLLAEHGGFVRLGAHYEPGSVSKYMLFNKIALDVLMPLLAGQIDEGISRHKDHRR